MSVDNVQSDDATLEETVDYLVTRVAELSAENEQLRERVEELESQPRIEWDEENPKNIKVYHPEKGFPFNLGEVALEKLPASFEEEDLQEMQDTVEDLEEGSESVGEIREDLINEQKTRSQADSRILRRINAVADAADVEVEEADIVHEDKIKRMIANGCDDVVDRVHKVHERAREVLLHAGDWGTKIEDTHGKRITLKSPEVREKLELRRDEKLQSKQVGDVFDKIVQLAEDSPRKAKTTKNGDGIRVLRIHLEEDSR